jgi:hypothetical protein
MEQEQLGNTCEGVKTWSKLCEGKTNQMSLLPESLQLLNHYGQQSETETLLAFDQDKYGNRRTWFLKKNSMCMSCAQPVTNESCHDGSQLCQRPLS